MPAPSTSAPAQQLDFYDQRVDLACAFRWTVRLNMHEAVANHFSLAVDERGTCFLMNPNQRHFGLIRASDLLLLDANDGDAMQRPDAPDPTAWGLHGAIHRRCPHARCLMHVHPVYATVLASLADSRLLPIDQNTATFHGRYVIDEDYGGLAFEAEGERCARLLSDPRVAIMIMGNHGVMAIGPDVAETFNRLYYFERAARTYITALATGRALRIMDETLAARVAREVADYPGQAAGHFADLKALLDRDEPGYRL